ncbi:MAG TPA: zf-TFIIB domain-containing protein [Chthonomonadaceae bacterium]|nr:zf-TFIIB domain-containing protein [Chthonomonadaceae bacterium]
MPLFTRNANLRNVSRFGNEPTNRAPRDISIRNEHNRSVVRSQEFYRSAAPRPLPGDRNTPMCPCCEKPLTARNLDDISVDVCLDCGGIWIGQGKMPLLVRRGLNALDALESEMGLPAGNIALLSENVAHLPCPHCSAAMEAGPYSYNLEARVDHCPQCHGSWVGAGELAAIMVHFADKLAAGRPAQAVTFLRSR